MVTLECGEGVEGCKRFEEREGLIFSRKESGLRSRGREKSAPGDLWP